MYGKYLKKSAVWLAAAFLALGAAGGAWLGAREGAGLLPWALSGFWPAEDPGFGPLFLRLAALLLALWVFGLLSVGLPFLAAGLMFCGAVYGYLSGGILYAGSGAWRLVLLLPGALLLLASAWGLGAAGGNQILNRFCRQPPKSHLRRERQRRFWEYLLIGLGALAPAALAVVWNRLVFW